MAQISIVSLFPRSFILLLLNGKYVDIFSSYAVLLISIVRQLPCSFALNKRLVFHV